MAELVSKTYSEALFEVALESNTIDSLRDELKFVVATFNEYPKLYEIMLTPKVNIDEKKAVFNETFGDKISDELHNFVKILFDKKRGSDIKDIYAAFSDRVDAHNGIVNVIVETVVEVNETQMENLTTKLKAITGKEVRIVNKISPDVLGGMVVRIGDKIIDGSVKRKLEELKDNLKQVVL